MSLIPSMASESQPWSRSTLPSSWASGWPKLTCIRRSCCFCSAFKLRNLGPCWVTSSALRSGLCCKLEFNISLWEGWNACAGSRLWDPSWGFRMQILLFSGSWGMDIGVSWEVTEFGSGFVGYVAWGVLFGRANTVINTLAGGALLSIFLLVSWVQFSQWSSQNVPCWIRCIPMVKRSGAVSRDMLGGGGLRRSAPLQASMTLISTPGYRASAIWIGTPSVKNRFPTRGARLATCWIKAFRSVSCWSCW